MVENELELIKSAANGDKNSFSLLYQHYKNDIFFYFLSRLNSRDDALDLTSEVFIKVIKHLKNFRNDSSFKTWIYTISKNILNDHLRNRYEKPMQRIEQEVLENTAEKFEDDLPQNDEDMRTIKCILDSLQDNYRQILELRYLLNYSFKECAETMNVTENNAKVIHNRAIRKAKEIAGVTSSSLEFKEVNE